MSYYKTRAEESIETAKIENQTATWKYAAEAACAWAESAEDLAISSNQDLEERDEIIKQMKSCALGDHKRTAEAILWALAEFDVAMCAALDGETGPKVEWGSIAIQRLKDRAVAILTNNLSSVDMSNSHFGFTQPMDFPTCESLKG